MEGIMSEPVQDGQEPKSAKEAVSQVVKSTTFLRVAGVCSASKSTSRGAISSQVRVFHIPVMFPSFFGSFVHATCTFSKGFDIENILFDCEN